MADVTIHPLPTPTVQTFTTHVTSEGIEMVVTGKNGSLALKFRADTPSIVFPDWERTDGGKYKAVCHLEANGQAVGWFIEKKEIGDPSKETMVFFPSMKKSWPERPVLSTLPQPAAVPVKKTVKKPVKKSSRAVHKAKKGVR